jgi:hypothetical protein
MAPLCVFVPLLDLRARKHLFIAGTGSVSRHFSLQIKQLERTNGRWELHYTCRTPHLVVC